MRVLSRETVYLSKVDLKQRILDTLPEAVEMAGDRGIKLRDVRDGKATMDDFVAQLDLTELEAISRGAYIMNSPLGVPGNAGVYGGVLPSLRAKGVPPVTTTDGPSGIRLYSCCSLLPIGTLLACTFDEALVEEVYKAVGAEMREKGTDVLLGPGINIHRNPLCGRNFEYYSEDPLVTGKIAAAAVRDYKVTAFPPASSILPATIRNSAEAPTIRDCPSAPCVKFTSKALKSVSKKPRRKIS